LATDRVTRRRRFLALGALLAMAGAWLVGEAGWIHAKAGLAQYLIGRSWESHRKGDPAAKPWPWADTRPIARLRVPGLGIDQFVLAGLSGRTLAFGPAMPDGTFERDVILVSGHRDTHFRFLRDLRTGEMIHLSDSAGRKRSYRVASREVADSRTQRLRLDAARPRLVLVTCFPFDAMTLGGPLRYVVTAEAI